MHLQEGDIGCFKDLLVLDVILATRGNSIRYLANLNDDMIQGQGIRDIEPLLLKGCSAEYQGSYNEQVIRPGSH
jgi:hypothetical protein